MQTNQTNLLTAEAPTQVHDADYARFLARDEVVSVSAHGASFSLELKAAGIFDFATAVLRFRKGTVATVDLSRHSAYGCAHLLSLNRI